MNPAVHPRDAPSSSAEVASPEIRAARVSWPLRPRSVSRASPRRLTRWRTHYAPVDEQVLCDPLGSADASLSLALQRLINSIPLGDAPRQIGRRDGVASS